MSENSSAKKSRLDRILDAIERAGNKLPDPITMFLGLAIIVTIISAICSAAGVSAVNPADGSTIDVFNLLSLDGIRYLWTKCHHKLLRLHRSHGACRCHRFFRCREEWFPRCRHGQFPWQGKRMDRHHGHHVPRNQLKYCR